jgi:hypothetical protein
MADGFRFQLSELIERPGDNPAISARFDFVGSRSLLDSLSQVSGTYANEQPISVTAFREDSGFKIRTFFDDFYNRFHIYPKTVAFGAISATVSSSVYVWNGYLSSASLTGIVISGTEDLYVEGPSLPSSFSALEAKEYNLVASQEGAVTLNALVEFSFSTGEELFVSATGTRAKISPVYPNWSSAFIIEYSFRTDIITTRSGREQRRAIRQTPRKRFQFEASPYGATWRTFLQTMALWQNNTIFLPEYPRSVALASPLYAESQTVVLVEDAPDWVVVGGSIILAHKEHHEVRIVQDVDGNVVTFTSASSYEFPAGSKLYYSVAGRLDASVSATRETNRVASVSVDFSVTPGSEEEEDYGTAGTTFKGRELFTVRPNWAAQPDVSFEWPRDVVDYDRGRTEIKTIIEFGTQTTTFTFVGRDFSGAEALRKLFCRMKGQQGEFYYPTWSPDIILKDTVDVGSRVLRIEGTDFATAFKDSTVFKAILIMKKDGTLLPRVVESIGTIDDLEGVDSTLVVTTAFDFALSEDTVRMICWLPVCRFASDSLTMEWLSSTVAQCQMSLKTLEDLS